MKENRKDFTVKVECVYCHEVVTVKVNKEDYESWQSGKYAQDAFPYLTPEERDILIVHMCLNCQHRIYGKFEE